MVLAYIIKKCVIHNFGSCTAGLHCALLAGKIQIIAVLLFAEKYDRQSKNMSVSFFDCAKALLYLMVHIQTENKGFLFPFL